MFRFVLSRFWKIGMFELCSKYTIDVAKKINSVDIRIQLMNVLSVELST